MMYHSIWVCEVYLARKNFDHWESINMSRVGIDDPLSRLTQSGDGFAGVGERDNDGT